MFSTPLVLLKSCLTVMLHSLNQFKDIGVFDDSHKLLEHSKLFMFVNDQNSVGGVSGFSGHHSNSKIT